MGNIEPVGRTPAPAWRYRLPMTERPPPSAARAAPPTVPLCAPSGYRPGAAAPDGWVRLGSNESPLPPSPAVAAAVTRALAQANRYPDPACGRLRAALAQRWDVAPEALLFGAGSAELLALVAQRSAAGGEVVFPWPTFPLYAAVAEAAGARPVPVPLSADLDVDVDAILAAVTPRTTVVIVANPNNPTGRPLGHEAAARLSAGLPERALLVWDEAYADYAEPGRLADTRALLEERPRTLVARTFSKAYGLAGLRVGFAFGSPDLVAALEGGRHPFTVGTLAQAAAEAALLDEAHHRRAVALARAGVRQLSDGLRALGLRVVPSEANFVAVQLEAEAQAVEDGLRRRGVVARGLAGFGLPRHLRVTAGLTVENDRFLVALRGVLAEPGGASP